MSADQRVALILDRPLDRLDALGLPRPRSFTLRRYILALAAEGLFESATATTFLDVYQRAIYGAEPVVPQETQAVVVAMLDQLDLNSHNIPGAIRALGAQTQAPPDIPHPQPGKNTTSEVLSIDDVELPPPTESAETAEPPAAPAHSRVRWHLRWIWRAACVGIISLLLIGLGYLGAPHIDRAREELAYRYFGAVRTTDIENLRRRAIADPDDAHLWLDWARQAERRGRLAEAVVAYRQVLARQPDNADLLNEVAWLLCTAEDAWVRGDPARALKLAERAYALDQAPPITDTLAEAAFRTGDTRRAVALEEDAIRRLDGDDAFYRRQLRKFRAALAQSENQPRR